MKRIAILFFLGVGLLFSSCEQQGGKQYKTLDDKSEIFKVRILGVFPQDDIYSLYYTTDGSIDFTKIKPIYLEVKHSATPQEITFSLPKKVRPTQLRIDFGIKAHSQEIALKQIALSYKGKAVALPGTLIFSYFMPDVSKTSFDPGKATIRGIVKHGQMQSPSLYPKKGPLSDELEKILE